MTRNLPTQGKKNLKHFLLQPFRMIQKLKIVLNYRNIFLVFHWQRWKWEWISKAVRQWQIKHFEVWMKLVWAGGSGRVRAAMEPPAEPPRGTVMSAEPDRCIHLWMTEFPGRSPLPPCPSSISIWVCSPHPGGTPAPCPQCTVAPSAAAADADTGDSAPAMGLTGICPQTPLLPAEKPRTGCSQPWATGLASPWPNQLISGSTSATHSGLTDWEVLN